MDLSAFIELLERESEGVTESHGKSLEEIFESAVDQTMREIKFGANSDDFKDLVVVNFVVAAAKNGYATDEIHNFVMKLSDGGD